MLRLCTVLCPDLCVHGMAHLLLLLLTFYLPLVPNRVHACALSLQVQAICGDVRPCTDVRAWLH